MTQENRIIYMDASLVPNRSLSPRAFIWVMAIIGGTSFVAGIFYLSMGAFPVVGFFGIDVLAIWLAFRWSFRDQRQETRIQITADTIALHHTDGRGREKSAELPTAFARIELAEPVRWDSWLRLEHGKTAYVIGRFLTPDERKSLATALREAIMRARAERFTVTD
ncbi:MAG: DUF2244 domain-containing protein [Hyphomonadaceae bacterium]